MVTAELAVLMPFGMAVGFLLLWVVSLGLTQVQLVDSSREAARMLARGDRPAAAKAAALEHAPEGTTLHFATGDGFVTVTASTRSAMKLPMFSHIGSMQLQAQAVSADESP